MIKTTIPAFVIFASILFSDTSMATTSRQDSALAERSNMNHDAWKNAIDLPISFWQKTNKNSEIRNFIASDGVFGIASNGGGVAYSKTGIDLTLYDPFSGKQLLSVSDKLNFSKMLEIRGVKWGLINEKLLSATGLASSEDGKLLAISFELKIPIIMGGIIREYEVFPGYAVWNVDLLEIVDANLLPLITGIARFSGAKAIYVDGKSIMFDVADGTLVIGKNNDVSPASNAFEGEKLLHFLCLRDAKVIGDYIYGLYPSGPIEGGASMFGGESYYCPRGVSKKNLYGPIKIYPKEATFMGDPSGKLFQSNYMLHSGYRSANPNYMVQHDALGRLILDDLIEILLLNFSHRVDISLGVSLATEENFEEVWPSIKLYGDLKFGVKPIFSREGRGNGVSIIDRGIFMETMKKVSMYNIGFELMTEFIKKFPNDGDGAFLEKLTHEINKEVDNAKAQKNISMVEYIHSLSLPMGLKKSVYNVIASMYLDDVRSRNSIQDYDAYIDKFGDTPSAAIAISLRATAKQQRDRIALAKIRDTGSLDMLWKYVNEERSADLIRDAKLLLFDTASKAAQALFEKRNPQEYENLLKKYNLDEIHLMDSLLSQNHGFDSAKTYYALFTFSEKSKQKSREVMADRALQEKNIGDIAYVMSKLDYPRDANLMDKLDNEFIRLAGLSNKKYNYELYLDKAPLGRYKEKAISSIFAIVEKENTMQTYADFYLKHNTSIWGKKADDQAFILASQKKEENNYDLYIKLFPKGRHLNQALDNLYDHAVSTKNTSALREIAAGKYPFPKQDNIITADDALFHILTEENGSAGFLEYIDALPQGRHNKEALQKIWEKIETRGKISEVADFYKKFSMHDAASQRVKDKAIMLLSNGKDLAGLITMADAARDKSWMNDIAGQAFDRIAAKGARSSTRDEENFSTLFALFPNVAAERNNVTEWLLNSAAQDKDFAYDALQSTLYIERLLLKTISKESLKFSKFIDNHEKPIFLVAVCGYEVAHNNGGAESLLIEAGAFEKEIMSNAVYPDIKRIVFDIKTMNSLPRDAEISFKINSHLREWSALGNWAANGLGPIGEAVTRGAVKSNFEGMLRSNEENALTLVIPGGGRDVINHNHTITLVRPMMMVGVPEIEVSFIKFKKK